MKKDNNKHTKGKTKARKKKLSKAQREKKHKESEIRALILEVSFYVVFLALLLRTASNNRDNKAFGYRHSTLSFINAQDAIHKIETADQFWQWTRSALLPFLYPTRDWNNSVLKGSSKQVSTFASYKVGPLRIRQHRVKDEECSINPHFRRMDIRCVHGWASSYSDNRHYLQSWEKVLETSQWNKTGGEWSAWDYRGWSHIGGIPVMGVFGVYPTGGYVLDITDNLQGAAKDLDLLEDSDWIDWLTRFISVEFTLFCPGVNMFAMVQVIFEFPQAGIMMGTAHLYPFRLFSYVGGYPLATMVCDALVYVGIVWFIIRESVKVYEERLKYFTEMWNILELVNLLLSITAITLYVGRHIVSTYVSKEVSKGKGQYFNFQTIAMWDELFNILLGFVCLLSTLQLLHLLRFNRRMSLLAATMKEAAKDLSAFFLVFIIVFLAFVSFCYIMFGSNLGEYSSVIKSAETLVTVSLGSFDYYALRNVNPIFAPVVLFLYMMFIVFILINMLITILNDAFAVVREDASKQPNDYELIDYIVARLAAFLWTLNPVRIIWGSALNAGIVNTEAPEVTQKSEQTARVKRSRPRRAGVNYRPRHRHRSTFNANLVRVHNRLDTLDYLIGHFTHVLEAEKFEIDDFRMKKKISFRNPVYDECHVMSLSLDESGFSSKEQVVPGIQEIRHTTSSRDEQDKFLPEVPDIQVDEERLQDGVLIHSISEKPLKVPNTKETAHVNNSYLFSSQIVPDRSDTFNKEACVVLELSDRTDFNPDHKDQRVNFSDHVVVDLKDGESSM